MRYSFAAMTLLALTGNALVAHAESSTTITGKAFLDYTYKDNRDLGSDGAAADEGAALDLKRFYLTVDHGFDQTWSVRLRTDVGDLNKKFDVFVKNAYVQAALAPQLVLRVGAADTPWIPFVEDLYGYRYVEPILIDRTKFGNSADYGLHAVGNFGGVASYAVSVVNGRGYSDPTRNEQPTVEARIATTPIEGLTLALGGLSGKLGQAVEGTSTVATANRLDAMVAWVGGGLRLGVEGFYGRNDTPAIVTGKAPRDTELGGSVWASYDVRAVSFFGRVDYLKPSIDVNSKLQDVYFNAGVQYKPAKPVNLALVYKHEQVDHGALGTANGTIGSSTPGKGGRLDEVGLFTQYAF